MKIRTCAQIEGILRVDFDVEGNSIKTKLKGLPPAIHRQQALLAA